MKKLFAILVSIFICGILFAQTKNAAQKNLGTMNIDITKLANATNDKNAPAVYFSREISSESILKLYKATGKKLSGKIALKVIFEGPRKQKNGKNCTAYTGFERCRKNRRGKTKIQNC